MAAYTYKALNSAGVIDQGVLEGDSERHVRNQLRARQLQPLEVAPAPHLQVQKAISLTRESLPAAQLTLVTRQLATLVLSDVPLDEALHATARQTPVTGVKNLLMQIRSKVLAGQSLAGSLAAFPQAFSRMFQAMVRAGEHAGLLGEVLEQLADYNERRLLLQQKLKMALIYPLVLLLVASAVITMLMVFVIPELVSLFEKTDTPLPLLTRILISLSSFLSHWWWLLLLLIAGSIWLLRHLLQGSTRRYWDALVLRLPLAGAVLTSADTARFASTLSILMKSGVALVEAITIAADVMSNSRLRERTAQVALAVEEGGALARALDSCGFFSPLLVQMVASGEASGSLEAMLVRAAHNQEQELELMLNSLVKIAEPLIIVVMAVIVGTIVLSVLLPIMQMNTLVA